MSSQSQAEGVLGLSAAELRKEVSALIINQSEPRELYQVIRMYQ